MRRIESDTANHYTSLMAIQKDSLLAEKEGALERERMLHNKTFDEVLSQREVELKAAIEEEFIKQLQVVIFCVFCHASNIISLFSVCCLTHAIPHRQAQQHQAMTQYERAYGDKLAEKRQEVSKAMADEVEKIEQRVAYESESHREEIKSMLSRLATMQVINVFEVQQQLFEICHIFNMDIHMNCSVSLTAGAKQMMRASMFMLLQPSHWYAV